MSNVNFGIIKHSGDPKKAWFTDPATGEQVMVEKHDSLYVPEWDQSVKCIDYHGEHFIFEVPARLNVGGSSYLCTCGSAAVVAPPEGPGRMFVCQFHATSDFGVHQTSIINKDDFADHAAKDKPIIIDRDITRKKKWD